MKNKKGCWAYRLLQARVAKSWYSQCKARREGLCCAECQERCERECTYSKVSGPYPCHYYLTTIEAFWRKLFGKSIP